MQWILLALSFASVALLAYLALRRDRSDAGATLVQQLDEAQRRGSADYQAALQRATVLLLERMKEADAALQAGLIERLAQGSESLSTRVSASLREGREELAKGLVVTTATLERKFAELAAATEKKLAEIRGEVEKKLGETVAANQKSFEGMATQLQALEKTAGQMVELSKGVNDLNVLLKTPRARGAFGEMTLEQMLADLFGDQTDLYEVQYTFPGGERVDAVVKVREQLLCVDAKFPLDNARPLLEPGADEETRRQALRAFRRDVINQARRIRDLYIRPPTTLDMAFMFVPAESVYYQVLSDPELHQELLALHVIPASPNSFYAYLKALAYALRGLKLEQHAEVIRRQVAQLGTEFQTFGEDFRLLGKHLKAAHAKYSESDESMAGFRRVVESIVRADQGEALPTAVGDEPAPLVLTDPPREIPA